MLKDMVSKLKVKNPQELARLSDEDGKTVKKSIKTEAGEAIKVKNTDNDTMVDQHRDSSEMNEEEDAEKSSAKLKNGDLTTIKSNDTVSYGSIPVVLTSTALPTLSEAIEEGNDDVLTTSATLATTLHTRAQVFNTSLPR
jgi:TusA-related sulfurtransferase